MASGVVPIGTGLLHRRAADQRALVPTLLRWSSGASGLYKIAQFINLQKPALAMAIWNQGREHTVTCDSFLQLL